MNALLALLALLGLILMIIGRIMISSEARQISLLWLYAIRFVPLADVMFLARYWELAKTGVFTSLVGLAFIAPWGGKMIWEASKRQRPFVPPTFATLTSTQKKAIFEKVVVERERRASLKEQRLTQLNTRMDAWYKAMQARRAAVTLPSEIEDFNQEAAAYSALHAFTKDEAAEIVGLRSLTRQGADQLTEADLAAFLRPLRRSPAETEEDDE